MKIIKPKKCWINDGAESKSVEITEAKNYFAEGWKIGRLVDKAEQLEKIQKTKEEIESRKSK